MAQVVEEWYKQMSVILVLISQLLFLPPLDAPLRWSKLTELKNMVPKPKRMSSNTLTYL
ncbi:hypothetical protein HanRHA438_Chr10g0463311 [Helianthus annuus]|nr:hypothetical protein HanRHA438_Chr10g0463311 [Helianthus annuus]